MEDKPLTVSSSGNPESAANLAFQVAREKLLRVDDISELCRKSGARSIDTGVGKSIVVDYLNRPYRVSLPDAGISPVEGKDTIPIREKLLVLHYLLTAKGTPPAARLVSFQELPEGNIYYPTFLKRSVQPLVANFGADPGCLLPSTKALGGKKEVLGDVSVAINAFSRVPIKIVIWQSDAEFEARGNILFDAGVPDYLPAEDITVLCEIISWKIIKSRPVK